MVTDNRARCDTCKINQSFVLPFGCTQLQNGKRESSSVSLYSIQISRLEQKVEFKQKQQVSLASLFWGYLALVYAFVAMNENQTFLWIWLSMACLSVCWKFIIRWDLENHGLQLCCILKHLMGTLSIYTYISKLVCTEIILLTSFTTVQASKGEN